MRIRFRPDRGLTARMAVTVGLLGVVYVAFVAALVALLESTVVVVMIAGALLAVQYWFSDRIALLAMRAREVGPDQAPALHGLVDRLCAAADMPKPRTRWPTATCRTRSPSGATAVVRSSA
jgi:heat shock protein HtpX